MRAKRSRLLALGLLLPTALLAGSCAWLNSGDNQKTKKGAAAGAAAGAVLGAVIGEGEADEILAGAAIGAGVGAGVGVYMDRQEEELADIPNATVERVDEDTMIVHMDADDLFAEGSAVLSSEAEDTLDKAAEVLKDNPETAVVVQGHVDDDGSDEERAEDISERRAEAVKKYLVSQGVDEDRIRAVGYGSQYAEADRVDLLVKAKAA